MISGVFGWYDKVDKIYLPDSILLSRSERATCRGYLQSFANDKRMNAQEYELVRYGDFDDEKGAFSMYDVPKVVDVRQVFSQENLDDGRPHDE